MESCIVTVGSKKWIAPDMNTMQLVLPESIRKHALHGCHDDLGHLGIEQTIYLLRDCFLAWNDGKYT